MPEEVIGLIQGQTPDSKEEYWIALALDSLEVVYMYHFEILGGRAVSGGQVLDFLVFTPFGVPLQYFGGYWHEGELGKEDDFKLAVLENYFGQTPIVLVEGDCETPEKTKKTVKAKLYL